MQWDPTMFTKSNVKFAEHMQSIGSVLNYTANHFNT